MFGSVQFVRSMLQLSAEGRAYALRRSWFTKLNVFTPPYVRVGGSFVLRILSVSFPVVRNQPSRQLSVDH